jgi:hypothetical protein
LTPSSTFNNYSLSNFQSLIGAYGQWFHDQIDDRWDAYFFTFEFNQLPGPQQERLRLMKAYLHRWYGRLVTRTVRNPRSPRSIDLLPKALLVPDYPVPKRLKKTLRQVSINDGIHWHGLVLATRVGTRLQEPLDVHFREHGATYFTKELHHINVKPITYTPEYITGYGMKSLKSSRISGDDILIFPRSVSELPIKGPVRAAGEKPMYDFQRK